MLTAWSHTSKRCAGVVDISSLPIHDIVLGFSKIVTRCKNPTGKWTRKPLVRRESYNCSSRVFVKSAFYDVCHLSILFLNTLISSKNICTISRLLFYNVCLLSSVGTCPYRERKITHRVHRSAGSDFTKY